MSIETNIQSAIADLRAEPDALVEIAAEYGIKADVLAARFARAFPDGVPAPIDMASRVEEAVVAACSQYQVSRSGVIGPIKAANGRRVFVIGRSGSKVHAVCCETAHLRTMGLGNFTDALLRSQGIGA